MLRFALESSFSSGGLSGAFGIQTGRFILGTNMAIVLARKIEAEAQDEHWKTHSLIWNSPKWSRQKFSPPHFSPRNFIKKWAFWLNPIKIGIVDLFKSGCLSILFWAGILLKDKHISTCVLEVNTTMRRDWRLLTKMS